MLYMAFCAKVHCQGMGLISSSQIKSEYNKNQAFAEFLSD